MKKDYKEKLPIKDLKVGIQLMYFGEKYKITAISETTITIESLSTKKPVTINQNQFNAYARINESIKLSELKTLIKEEIEKVKLSEALTFPAGKYDEEYKKLIKLAQTLPNWDEKPYHDRNSGTLTIEGKYNGIKTWFEYNNPGNYCSIYNFRGIKQMGKPMFDKGKFYKSGDAIDKFMDEEMGKVAKETGLSSRVPMVWLKAAKRLPEELIKSNLKEFETAINSMK